MFAGFGFGYWSLFLVFEVSVFGCFGIYFISGALCDFGLFGLYCVWVAFVDMLVCFACELVFIVGCCGTRTVWLFMITGLLHLV